MNTKYRIFHSIFLVCFDKIREGIRNIMVFGVTWRKGRGVTEWHSQWVILVNMEISVILGHEKTKICNIIDYGKIDIFSVRTNIHIKNKMMGHLI